MGYYCCWTWMRSAKKMSPHFYMLLTQIIAASYAVLSKIVFSEGTNPVVFNVYQFTIATIFMAPLAYFLERKSRPPLSLSITCWIFLLSLLGATLFQNLFSASLNYISSTSQSAIINLFPAFTYILSISLKQEAAELNRLRGVGKLFGTLISVLGAFTLIFWRVDGVNSIFEGSLNWAFGFVLATAGVLSLSSWLVLQVPITVRYPAELSITAMMYFFGTLQTCVIAAFSNLKASEWKLDWDLELLNILFGGVLNSGIGIFIFTWCARKKGPLFVAVFSPLNLLLTAIMEMITLGNTMDVGSFIGSLMIVGGLYIFLWSKSKEEANESMDTKEEVSSPFLINQIP